MAASCQEVNAAGVHVWIYSASWETSGLPVRRRAPPDSKVSFRARRERGQLVRALTKPGRLAARRRQVSTFTGNGALEVSGEMKRCEDGV